MAERAEELRDKVLEIEKTLLVPDLRAGWADRINHGARLLDKLAGLPAVVALGDYRPTDVVADVFADLTTRIDAEIARFDALVEEELPAINELIATSGFGAVSPRRPHSRASSARAGGAPCERRATGLFLRPELGFSSGDARCIGGISASIRL